ncbi:hypothetical protein [Halobacillus aidingensis]|uniref:Uncharacterized protein n=1 Tax=Halobacillus aidingensis TaxID=240303 RepID=A0A1H0RLG9_HALAD|nr:hypothetical protein [Halobacillus aidingensis]SDP30344.1 hypothetical protein SAMN05421677_11597 [Halobacillus aidingensis]
MIVVAFMPILILLAVIIALSLLIKKSSRFGFGRGKAGLWMLISYSVLLVVSAVIFLAIPLGSIELKGQEKEEKEEQKSQQFYEAVQEGKLDEIEEWRIHEWSFPFDKEQLILQVLENDVNGINIFVERTDDLTETVEAFYYQTPLMINGYEVEEKYMPAVSMVMTTLSIYPGEKLNLKYKMFGSEFPFRLFDKENGSMWGDTTVSHWNGTALYIRVPEGLDVVGDQNAYTEVNPS